MVDRLNSTYTNYTDIRVAVQSCSLENQASYVSRMHGLRSLYFLHVVLFFASLAFVFSVLVSGWGLGTGAGCLVSISLNFFIL